MVADDILADPRLSWVKPAVADEQTNISDMITSTQQPAAQNAVMNFGWYALPFETEEVFKRQCKVVGTVTHNSK